MLFSMPQILGMEVSNLSFGIAFVSSLLVTIGMGLKFWKAIPKIFGHANMNTLVGLGIAASYGLSFWQWSQGHREHLYFDSAAFVAAFVLLGQWMEGLCQRKIREKLPDLLSEIPQHARLLDGTSVKVGALQLGDKIRVLPGERVPADAKLLSAEAEVDESVLTGESKIISKVTGDLLLQGSVNQQQPVELEVTQISGDSYTSVLMDEMDSALKRKPEIQQRVDRWARVLSPAVVLIAVGSGIYWGYFQQNLELMMQTSVAVLVIACPCAVGIATPISLLVALVRAGRKGILIRNFDAIEKSGEVSIVAFDKTGTLTFGKPKVQRMMGIENFSHDEILKLASSLEAHSEHPYARAILEAAKERNLSPYPVKDLLVSAGKGLRAMVTQGNKEQKALVGNLVWLFENSIESTQVPEKLKWEADGSEDTVIWLAVNGSIVGNIFIGDAIRPEASKVIDDLGDKGYEVGLITGDGENVAAHVAKTLGLKFFHYGVVPSEKATIIRRLSEKKKKGMDFEYPRVAFVGDGINDGPALTEAQLGISMGSGTALAQNVSDIVLASNSLESVPVVFRILRESKSLIRENLLWAFAYNFVSIPIAAGVLYPFWGISLQPSWAAAAMSLSSVCVLLNSLRAILR